MTDADVCDASCPTVTALEPEWIYARLSEAVRLLPRPIGRVTVRIVSDRTMSELHRRHCDDPSTTDVLTFPADSVADGERGSGAADSDAIFVDIAICADEARRTAHRLGHEPRRELLLYALHGLLHCCGHDDRDDASFAAMHAEEDRILLAIGVGVTFRSGGENADESADGSVATSTDHATDSSTDRDAGGAA